MACFLKVIIWKIKYANKREGKSFWVELTEGSFCFSVKDEWLKRFPDAKKSHQSPINILTSSAVYDEELSKSPVQIKYEISAFAQITNNGHTFVVSGSSQNSLGTSKF